MINKMKTLLVVTTFNQLDYTKECYNCFLKSNIKDCDLLIIDDVSTDGTIEWCISNNINYISKDSGKGLTHSWNLAYKYFKEHTEYSLLIVANDDIIIPAGSIEELIRCHSKWPSICIVPMSNSVGCGHNPTQSIVNYYSDIDESPDAVQNVQDSILAFMNANEMKFRKFIFDPIRMLMFSGFLFSLKRDVIKYEREDGNMFDPELLNYKNEDDFNWRVLLTNDEYPMLCKTSYIFHHKGVSFAHIKDARTNNLESFLQNR